MQYQFPLIDICNLYNSEFTLNDVFVSKLSSFLKLHPGLYFPHRHSFYQILYFTEGEGSHSIDFEKYTIEKGQIYFMSPGQVHTWDFKSNIDGYLINFTEAFFSSYLNNSNLISEYPHFYGNSSSHVLNLTEWQQSIIRPIIESIHFESKEEQENKLDLIRALLLQLLLYTGRYLTKSDSKSISKTNKLILRNFRKHIESHFLKKRLPKDYAELLFITPNHLNALCKQSIGISAGDLIRNRVLLEAKRLLVNSEMNITQISQQLYFEDNSYFVKFFKKYVKVTPDEFRKSKLTSK